MARVGGAPAAKTEGPLQSTADTRWKIEEEERSGGDLYELDQRTTWSVVDTATGDAVLRFQGTHHSVLGDEGWEAAGHSGVSGVEMGASGDVVRVETEQGSFEEIPLPPTVHTPGLCGGPAWEEKITLRVDEFSVQAAQIAGQMGAWARVKVVDGRGAPFEGATVALSWTGPEAGGTTWRNTDVDGLCVHTLIGGPPMDVEVARVIFSPYSAFTYPYRAEAGPRAAALTKAAAASPGRVFERVPAVDIPAVRTAMKSGAGLDEEVIVEGLIDAIDQGEGTRQALDVLTGMVQNLEDPGPVFAAWGRAIARGGKDVSFVKYHLEVAHLQGMDVSSAIAPLQERVDQDKSLIKVIRLLRRPRQ